MLRKVQYLFLRHLLL
ncbi:RepA leader peptide Tap, partial [Salmonella enterica]|nr:RepA leader peptide Tap [Salmonella enterica subsp. enterica serovar Give]EAW0764687.1 RepA leader peptide Tap [Salmonella enterica subsp. enterica serovar Minnesota]